MISMNAIAEDPAQAFEESSLIVLVLGDLKMALIDPDTPLNRGWLLTLVDFLLECDLDRFFASTVLDQPRQRLLAPPLIPLFYSRLSRLRDRLVHQGQYQSLAIEIFDGISPLVAASQQRQAG